MLHRLAIILITGFWVVMTSLLVVRELYPEATRLNAIPLGYVAQITFQHQQSSDLRVHSAEKPEKEPGYLHIQPRTLPGSGRRVLEFNGSVTLSLPIGKKQHISWIGTHEMSPAFSPERLHLDLTTPEIGQHIDVVVDFLANTATFGTKVGGQVTNVTAFTLDEAGFGTLMGRAGVDPAMLRQLKASQSQMPKLDISAQSSSLVISGQKLETFLLSIKSGEQSVVEAHLSQLGQVLSAQVPVLGWKLTPFNLTR